MPTMNSMGSADSKGDGFRMENEKIYRTMSATGAGDIVIGILIITVGVAAGIIAIVNGARLLCSRKNIML